MNQEIKDYIKEKLKYIPDKSGVYFMKDEKNNIIYIGKAKSLKKRVNSYFTKSNKDTKTTALVEHIADFDYIITENEVEALIFEAEMIRKHKPH
nr:GIY-YIG nuclease family protein [Brachyspira catarrhinii]